MKKINVSFMFGAGAEGKGNFDLPTGVEFMRESYLNNKAYKKLSDNLKKIFDKDDGYFNNNYKVTADNYATQNIKIAILKKWLSSKISSKETFLKFEKDINLIFNKNEFLEIKAELDCENEKNQKYVNEEEKNTKNKERKEAVIKKFTDILKKQEISTNKENEKIVEKSVLTLITDKKGEHYQFKKDLPTGISHILDKDFHTIINPQKYGPRIFSRVYNYYWSIFNSIYEILLNKFIEDNLNKSTLNNENLKENMNYLYSEECFKKIKNSATHTYYNKIQKKLGKSEIIDVCGVITSNYFNFVEIIKTKKYAYLNGQLKLFEIPETLEVIDITENVLPKDKLYFPFIFGQSFTKPIVSKYQIEAFNNLKDILEESNALVILGYNLNEDDNHINSFIRSFICEQNGYLLIASNNPNIENIMKKLKIEKSDRVISVKINYPKSSDSENKKEKNQEEKENEKIQEENVKKIIEAIENICTR